MLKDGTGLLCVQHIMSTMYAQTCKATNILFFPLNMHFYVTYFVADTARSYEYGGKAVLDITLQL
jgi:hypothetical protein